MSNSILIPYFILEIAFYNSLKIYLKSDINSTYNYIAFSPPHLLSECDTQEIILFLNSLYEYTREILLPQFYI